MPASIAAVNIKSLPKKPPNGGSPAKDNNSIATDRASNGFDLEIPEISETVTNCLSSLLSIMIKENIPRVAKV